MPYIAAGDNLNMFLIGHVLSAGGAFFIRRRTDGDEVYKKVLTQVIIPISQNFLFILFSLVCAVFVERRISIGSVFGRWKDSNRFHIRS